MSIFNRYKNRMIVITITIILFVIIGVTAKDRDKVTSIEGGMSDVLSPIQKTVYNISESLFSGLGSITNFTRLRTENIELKKKVAALTQQNRMMDDLINQSEVLRNEAILRDTSNYSFIEAKVSAKDPGNWFDNFIIDKGTDDGIKKGDAVVQAIEFDNQMVVEGLVGRVIEANKNSSRVISIIDNGSNVSFKVIRTQDMGVLEGSVEEDISGFLFDDNAEIVTEDKLVTSGLGDVYIEGLYIGHISEIIKKSDELTKKIKVTPAVNFKKLRRVFVITGKAQ